MHYTILTCFWNKMLTMEPGVNAAPVWICRHYIMNGLVCWMAAAEYETATASLELLVLEQGK